MSNETRRWAAAIRGSQRPAYLALAERLVSMDDAKLGALPLSEDT